MTASPDSASADQDDGGSPSSSESDISPEPPEPPEPAPPEPPEPAPPEPPQPPQPSERAARLSPATAADVHVAVMPGVEGTFDTEWLNEHLSAALAHIRRSVRRVSVLMVDDERMTALHRRHLGAAHTTDVLTFPASEAGEGIDVDIAICADVARRQAEKRGHSPDRELLLYAIHGVLHCAGFDDREESGARAMHEEEDRILRSIGVGPTFAAGHAPAARRKGDER